MADPRTINYAGGQKIDNTEMVSKKIDDAVQPVVSSLTAEITRSTNEDQNLQNQVNELRTDLSEEIDNRRAGDTALDNKIGNLNDLETVNKSNTVAAINELKSQIPDVTKEYVDNADEQLHEADVNLQEQIDELKDTVLPFDEAPVENSEKLAKSGGTWKAIRFASVKVGETMFWPVCDLEEREVHSDKPFTFTIHGVEYSVEPPDATVDMKISKDIPDGWHACDGKAELLCSEYPELAKFFGGTQNDDGSWNNDGNNVADDWIKDSDELSHSLNAKIWLPYVQQKIIKVKY